MRLPSRVDELRQSGYDIQTEMVGEGATRIARYTLRGTVAESPPLPGLPTDDEFRQLGFPVDGRQPGCALTGDMA